MLYSVSCLKLPLWHRPPSLLFSIMLTIFWWGSELPPLAPQQSVLNTAAHVIILSPSSYHAILCSKPSSHFLSDLTFYCLPPCYPWSASFSCTHFLIFPWKPQMCSSLRTCALALSSGWDAISCISAELTISSPLGHKSNVIWVGPSLTTLFKFVTPSPNPRNPLFIFLQLLSPSDNFFTYLLPPCPPVGLLSVLFTDLFIFLRIGLDPE